MDRNRESIYKFRDKQKKLRIALIILLLIFVIVFTSVIKILLQKRKEDNNIDELNRKIQSIDDKNDTLKDLIKQANNPTEKEDIIRNNLNMKAEGEHVIVINDNKVETEIKLNFKKQTSDTDSLTNYQKWYYYFFGDNE